MKYNVVKNDCVKRIDDKIFINVDFGDAMKKNPFSDTERTLPVFMNNLIDVKIISILNIPENYEVESLPERMAIALPNKEGKFHFDIKQVGNSLNINYNLKINKDIFSPAEYGSLSNFITLINEKEGEKIILRPKA